jgi:hypothetical protein
MIEKLRMRSIELRSMAALAFVALSLATGCGGGGAAPARPAEVRAVIAASNEAFFAGQWAKNCGYYTADARSEIVDSVPEPARNCADAWRKLHSFLDQRLSPEQLDAIRAFLPAKIEIDGDHATATFGKPPPSFPPQVPVEGATIELVRDNGRWLIDSLLF